MYTGCHDEFHFLPNAEMALHLKYAETDLAVASSGNSRDCIGGREVEVAGEAPL